MQVLTEEELPEGKNKAIIHQNAGYASLCKQIHFIQINQICGIESSLFKCVGMIFSGVCEGETSHGCVVGKSFCSKLNRVLSLVLVGA